LGLSRHSLRKALDLLEADGWISREVGRGTFLRLSAGDTPEPSVYPGHETNMTVPSGRRARGASSAFVQQIGDANPAANRTTPLSTDLTDFGPADVMAVRHIIEPNAMTLVVARATARDFEQMSSCLQGGDKASTHEEFEFWDLELHRTILSASRNPLLIRLYGSVEEARHSPIWGDLKRRNSSDARRADYRRDHHAIVAALSSRDSDRAREAMQVHLVRVDGHLFGSPGLETHGRQATVSEP
jgi:DNA-binding FadR family transcriptional regulator